MCSPNYDGLRWRIWQKTGCLLTSDGSDDACVAPEGLKNYTVPPPVEHLEVSVALPDSNSSEGAAEPPPDIPEAAIVHVEEEEGRVDNEQDRLIDDNVGRKIKALYENGWFTGTIMYYNVTLNEYIVKFEDNTEDYITLDDVDGVEMYFV